MKLQMGSGEPESDARVHSRHDEAEAHDESGKIGAANRSVQWEREFVQVPHDDADEDDDEVDVEIIQRDEDAD